MGGPNEAWFSLTCDDSHGAQGILDTAGKAALENEFGTTDENACMIKILEAGEFQANTVSIRFRDSAPPRWLTLHIQAREREGVKNDANGPIGITR